MKKRTYNNFGTKLASYTYDAWGRTEVTYHNGGASTVAMNPVTLFYGGTISATSIYAMYELPILISRHIYVLSHMVGG